MCIVHALMQVMCIMCDALCVLPIYLPTPTVLGLLASLRWLDELVFLFVEAGKRLQSLFYFSLLGQIVIGV